ncbi:DeoR/GlpR transcriptional regulator [Coriobacteriaceae bacterium]|uniref:Lactose phosphotransferase system repressor n=1 Tax=Granulimonas faecalis TaxID=2894155 RepID=A0AAV5B3Q4_9ACTN|nr:DeoR/GlpR family DNA-binding transcription regulator [Granulimonas faecalis]TGY59204.1 DeoR/GlpR transcriptional regulator [Coriobacteriaceae bacterium]GJM55902.1 DeoR family transcriptional regulator [Granulimonas faecalis]
MLKSERQDAIQRLCEALGTVTVRQIAEELQVSDMTVRRDLEEMSGQDRVVRVHGGARRVTGERGAAVPREYTHREKRALHVEEKRAVAARAAVLVEPGETVFLGAGTTMERLAQVLPAGRLRVVTNSLSVFDLLRDRPDTELCLVGGIYRTATDAFVGPMAEKSLEPLGIDAAFIGCNGVVDGAVSTSNMEEGRFQNEVLERSDRRYVVCDSSKVGRRDFYAFYSLADVDALVTDRLLAAGEVEDLSAYTEVLN